MNKDRSTRPPPFSTWGLPRGSKSMFPNCSVAFTLTPSAALSLPIAYLFRQTHGPYEESREQIVWYLNPHDFSRWAVFPAPLILPGIRAFHYRLPDGSGRLGYWGFLLTCVGLTLAAGGQIWEFFLIDPWAHPLHGVDFLAQLIAILILMIGIPTWAYASFRTLSGWQLAIPSLWVLYIACLFFVFFINDGASLYTRYGIDGSFLADIVIGAAYVLVGISLWPIRKEA